MPEAQRWAHDNKTRADIANDRKAARDFFESRRLERDESEVEDTELENVGEILQPLLFFLAEGFEHWCTDRYFKTVVGRLCAVLRILMPDALKWTTYEDIRRYYRLTSIQNYSDDFLKRFPALQGMAAIRGNTVAGKMHKCEAQQRRAKGDPARGKYYWRGVKLSEYDAEVRKACIALWTADEAEWVAARRERELKKQAERSRQAVELSLFFDKVGYGVEKSGCESVHGDRGVTDKAS
jgi:hypothetical protein